MRYVACTRCGYLHDPARVCPTPVNDVRRFRCARV